MQKQYQRIILPEGKYEVEVCSYDDGDKKALFSIYRHWRDLCIELEQMSARKINLPEGLSEGAFCLEMNCVRVTTAIPGANSSWDCYDSRRNKRIQVKACSVLPDLTSFGPKSQWDELYFLDFYRKGNWDGTFDIYLIQNDDIYNAPVKQGQTLKQQQEEKRRPRFSIFSDIIIPKKLIPVKTGKLS